MYEKIKKYYDAGLWDEERVKVAYERGVISQSEYEEIVGDK